MKRFAGAILALSLFAGPVLSEFAEAPRDVPIARLEENIEAYLKTHPDDPQAFYILGRLYAIAYAREGDRFNDVYLGEEGALPGIGEYAFDTFLPLPREAWRDQARRQLSQLGGRDLTAEEKARVEELLAFLDSDDYGERAKAQEALAGLGPSAVATLEAALARGGLSAEQRGRIEAVVRAIESSTQGATFLSRAIEAYEKALRNKADHHLARLGLAWCLEEAGRTDEAIDAYRKAHFGAAQAELGKEEFSHMAGGWHQSVAYEAGINLLDLLPSDAEDRDRIEENVEALKEKIDQAGQWITPLVVPLEEARELAELVDPGAAVLFDLDGDGVTRPIEWLRPSAGLLVWDPALTGRIESGWQLFGSVTWGVFWRNGYEPLAFLDDDGDGWIAGEERKGLAIWRDADADGASGPGEVRPLADHGIVALGCRPVPGDGVLWSPDGARFAGGSVRPTFDWVPRSAGR